MPGRKYTAGSSYRYGFNGKENDNDVKGEGNQQDYGERIYDPRSAKFLSIDPLEGEYPMLTPYQFGSNRPIDGVDQDGLEWKPVTGADGNVTDYIWAGFNSDGSAPRGTVSGGTIVRDGTTYNFSSTNVTSPSFGNFRSGVLSVNDGSNVRMNALISSGNSTSYSFDELNDEGTFMSVFASGSLGNATGASGSQIGAALKQKYDNLEFMATRPASGAIDQDGLGLFDWIGPGEVKAIAGGVIGTAIRKEAANAIVSKVVRKVELSVARRTGVKKAWKEEQVLVKATGEGTRDWSVAEKKQLLKKGKVSGYYGHHIKSVNHHSVALAKNPNNVEMVTFEEHLFDRHKGNFKNKSSGKLLDRTIKKKN